MRIEQRARAAQRSWGVQSPDDLIEAQEAFDLVFRAFSHGTSNMELSRITGLSGQTFSDIRNHKHKLMKRKTRDAIVRHLADNDDLRSFKPGSRVPAKYCVTMSHALSAQGWSQVKQQELLETNLGKTAGFIRGVTSYNAYANVCYENDQAMRWLVRQIGDATGPSTRSMSWARKRGYFPTKHYDVEGNLVVKSLPKELRQSIEGV